VELSLRKLRVVDLCCGAGLASLGLRAAGFEVLYGIDSWEEACEAFPSNLGLPAVLAATTIEVEAWESEPYCKVDLVIAGPPCQDDSRFASMHADRGRGELKSPSFEAAVALEPTWIVVEMVGDRWVPWAQEMGARQILRLVDHELGGATSRERTFAVWGPRDLEVRPVGAPRAWNEVLGVDDPGALLASDINRVAKRWEWARKPGQPAQTVTGGGGRHLLRLSDGSTRRLTLEEEAKLQGHSEIDLSAIPTVRGRQTALGNGWPRAFGEASGAAIIRAAAGRNLERGPRVRARIDWEETHARAVTAQQPRDTAGRYESDDWEALCVCGHRLGDHTAAAPHECLGPNFDGSCSCTHFRKTKNG